MLIDLTNVPRWALTSRDHASFGVSSTASAGSFSVSRLPRLGEMRRDFVRAATVT